MKIRLTLSLFSLLFIFLVLPGNKNGRASQAGKGNTGAPGDQTLNGSPYTCMDCHDDGNFNPFVSIHVVDSSNTAVSQYMPGQHYIARVTINTSGATPAGYGFQMIALRDNGNTDLDGFTDVNPNNYKLATISNGRTYAEHPTVSASDTFNVRWTAPPAGTGSVTFYAAGNAVNGNNNSDGDGANTTSLHLFEQVTLSTSPEQSNLSGLHLQVSPNPVPADAALAFDVSVSAEYALRAYDLSGNLVWQENRLLPAGRSTGLLETNEWPAGTYYVCLSGTHSRQTVKILKL